MQKRASLRPREQCSKLNVGVWCTTDISVQLCLPCHSFLDYCWGFAFPPDCSPSDSTYTFMSGVGLLNEFRHSRYYTPLNIVLRLYMVSFIDSTLIKSTLCIRNCCKHLQILTDLILKIAESRLQLRQHRSF